jgi:hypothetical protein
MAAQARITQAIINQAIINRSSQQSINLSN